MPMWTWLRKVHVGMYTALRLFKPSPLRRPCTHGRSYQLGTNLVVARTHFVRQFTAQAHIVDPQSHNVYETCGKIQNITFLNMHVVRTREFIYPPKNWFVRLGWEIVCLCYMQLPYRRHNYEHDLGDLPVI